MKTLKHLLPTLMACATLGTPAPAQSLDEVFDISIRPGWRENGGQHIAGIEIALAPGWKTYWRQPGDIGIPPQFSWNGSEGIADISVEFPTPKVTWDYGMRSIGYENHVVFPLIVDAAQTGPLRLNGTLILGVCEEICIPVEVAVRATLPAKGSADRAIQGALDDRPTTRTKGAKCDITPLDDGLRVTVQMQLPPLAGMEAAAIEVAQPTYWVAEPELTRQGNTLIATTEVLAPSGQPSMLQRSGIVTTVIGEGQAIQFVGCAGR